MKKILTFVSAMAIFPSLLADMVYDPATSMCYSIPRAAGINAREYTRLIKVCGDIGIRLSVMDDPNKFAIIRSQIFDYLKRVGTPTALRLQADLEKNVVIFPDGTFCGPFFIN